MNFYPLVRPLLFSLDPELAHTLSLKLLKLSHQTQASRLYQFKAQDKPVKIMGLTFPNRVGLAAGLDKNGDYIDPLSDLGFGFIEIGTVTPRPQPGNPKPRLFRLKQHQAIINRMGFNNSGIDHLLAQVEQAKYTGILGINIGKNFDTPIDQANQDYLIGLRKSYAQASYITINISSPNTKNLRQLQQGDEIKRLLADLKNEQARLAQKHQKYTPLVLKIAPDLDQPELEHIAKLLLEFEIDGVIATNTTIDKTAVTDHPQGQEGGGLSGKPLTTKSTAIIAALNSELNGKLPIIAAGGIFSTSDARVKLEAGASLIQIYSGLIYQGPELVKQISTEL